MKYLLLIVVTVVVMVACVETGVYDGVKTKVSSVEITWDNNPTRGKVHTNEQLKAVQREINRRVKTGEDYKSLVKYRHALKARLK